MVYDRLTFFAWPRYYHWFFNQTMRYGIGDVTHSSGTHDHFNQWLWQRLLWAPQRSAEDVEAEYARTWFGPETAHQMIQAIFQLEDNLAEKPGVPIAKKVGIDRYYRLVHAAGARMPPLLMKSNWLWREYMQKAALDKYIQLSVRQQAELQAKIEKAIAGANPDAAIDRALARRCRGVVVNSEGVRDFYVRHGTPADLLHARSTTPDRKRSTAGTGMAKRSSRHSWMILLFLFKG